MTPVTGGNTLEQARGLGITAAPRTFTDTLGNGDYNDYYRIRLGARSRFSLSLTDLESDVDALLLDKEGSVLQRSNRRGTQAESIQRSLDSGTYYIRLVSRNRRRETAYEMTLSARPFFDIKFDYSFDSEGWFTSERRAALDAAADVWENIILDKFPKVPAGTFTPSVLNPATGEAIQDYVTTEVIDDLLVFVGARQLSSDVSNTLAVARPSGWFTNEPRYTGSDFEPWIGSISFDTATSWFFDNTPATSDDIPVDQYDFISTTVHELGHILGFFNTSVGINAFKEKLSGSGFNGLAAVEKNGGTPIPLESENSSHIQAGYEYGDSGKPLMGASIRMGERIMPTVLDLAILDDIGYDIDYKMAYKNPSFLPPAVIESDQTVSSTVAALKGYGRCGCASCLASNQPTSSSGDLLNGSFPVVDASQVKTIASQSPLLEEPTSSLDADLAGVSDGTGSSGFVEAMIPAFKETTYGNDQPGSVFEIQASELFEPKKVYKAGLSQPSGDRRLDGTVQHGETVRLDLQVGDRLYPLKWTSIEAAWPLPDISGLERQGEGENQAIGVDANRFQDWVMRLNSKATWRWFETVANGYFKSSRSGASGFEG